MPGLHLTVIIFKEKTLFSQTTYVVEKVTFKINLKEYLFLN